MMDTVFVTFIIVIIVKLTSLLCYYCDDPLHMEYVVHIIDRVHCQPPAPRMFEDHSASAIHQALLSARSSSSSSVRWQRFCEAGERCGCCGSRFAWQSTLQSAKMRSLAMTNCRRCGQVVCVACAQTRRPLPEGLEGRLCDRCGWPSRPEMLSEQLKDIMAQLAP